MVCLKGLSIFRLNACTSNIFLWNIFLLVCLVEKNVKEDDIYQIVYPHNYRIGKNF